MTESWTTLKLIQWTAGYFEKFKIPNPRLDAELLLAFVLKCKRIDLYTDHEKKIREKELAHFKELIQRRIKREPLQYIVGETEFYGLTFKVTPEVLIPRPETELLVEEALKTWQRYLSEDPRRKLSQGRPSTAFDKGRAESAGSGEPAQGEPTAGSVEGSGDKYRCQVLEIGTGSGCIAITLAKHLPEASIVATDISKEALEIAHQNAIHHKVADRIELIPADIAPWKRFTAEGRQFDLIVSNPPYVPVSIKSNLQPEIQNHEPEVAIFGGPDGLDFFRTILQDAIHFLKPGGHILFEIGDDQNKAVSQLLEKAGFQKITVRIDYQEIDRIIQGKKNG